jgi:hypothetical protein
MNDDGGLDALFQRYRAACPEVEPGAGFMPEVWRRIETRHSFRFVFERLGRSVMAASAALCLLLLVLNLISGSPARLLAPTYADALMADHTAEKTYYTEAIRTTPAENQLPDGFWTDDR